MSEKQVAVKVQDIVKTFKIPLEASNGLKQKLINTLKGRRGYREFSPLNGVSFEIEKGDFFGIVGRNGSGKSTLLKIIAGIYSPNEGAVEVSGTLVPFIELGVGFNPELTGRENVFLNGALLGFSHQQMEKMYDDIVEFAELEDFMEERLKNYSSGMQVRLAFSIAIRAEGDILLLDEVLAVGDESFQRKCYEYFAELKEKRKTVILVTHSMSAVEQFCNKAIMIEKGSIIAEGSSMEVAAKYSNLFIDQINKNNAKKNHSQEDERKEREKNQEVKIHSVDILQDNVVTADVKAFNPFSIEVSFESKRDVKEAICGVNIITSKGAIALATGTGTAHDNSLTLKKGITKVTFEVKENIFTEDNYMINIALAENLSAQKLLLKEQGVKRFAINGILHRKHSIVHPKIETKVVYGSKK